MRPGWLVVLAAGALYFLFFPRGLVNGDEYYYAGQAYALAHGRLVPAAGDPLAVLKGQEWAALRFPIGWPLALSGARLLGFRAMYLVPMLLHLAAGAAFARLMVRRRLPAWANVVYLFHPVVWGLSRTVMSDVPAVALLVIAVDAWEAGRAWLPGALLAYGVLMRLGGLLTGAGFGLAVLSDLKREPRRLTGLAVPTVLAAGTHMAVNSLVTGDPLTTPYVQGVISLLDGSRLAQHLILYVAGLAVMPPFPLVAFLLRAWRADRWWLGALPILAFFLPYAYHDESPRLMETLVGSQRLVLAAHAFLIIGTARVWGSLALPKMRLPALGAGLVMAIAGALALNRIRAPYEEVAQAVSACRPAQIGYEIGAGRVVAGVNASHWRYLDGSDPRGQDDVVVVGRVPITNRSSGPGPQVSYPELERYRHLCRAIGPFEAYDLNGRCGGPGEPCKRLRE
jgi:hypothetical protein